MSAKPEIRVLFFDVFGTCVAQRPPIIKEFSDATIEALNCYSIDAEVRAKASEMTGEKWAEFTEDWNNTERDFVRGSIKRDGNVDWRAMDAHKLESMCELLAQRGLILLDNVDSDAATTVLNNESLPSTRVLEGSLWTSAQLQHLSKIWHRLTPWPDTCRGLSVFNSAGYPTATLSNSYNSMLEELISHSNIPFTHILSSDHFGSYKPNPKVYLGAAEETGVRPEECALVAAHLADLKGAKQCGFRTIYVERPLEESAPELRGQGIEDVMITEAEGGFIGVAKWLGIDIE